MRQDGIGAAGGGVGKTRSRMGESSVREQLLRRLQGHLKFPGESGEVDYKSAVAFDPNAEFALKLVRHVLGMANAGGGSIVVGFTEELGKHEPDPALTDEIVASYDPTSFQQSVDRYVLGDKKPETVIEKVEHDGKTYPIIMVSGFAEDPFFCRSTKPQGKPILKEGALYIRDRAAKTVVVASPADWRQLLARCVQLRQSEMLDAFRDLLEQPTTGARPSPRARPYVDEFRGVVARETEVAVEGVVTSGIDQGAYYFWHAPLEARSLMVHRLIGHMERAELRNTGFPMGMVRINRFSAQAAQDGLLMEYYFPGERHESERWFLHVGGGFYLFRTYDDPNRPQLGGRTGGRIVAYTTRIWRIAEALEHCIALYDDIGLAPNDALYFEILHGSLDTVTLTNNDPRILMLRDRTTRRTDVCSGWEGTVAELKVRKMEIGRGFINELFEVFDSPPITQGEYVVIHQEFLDSRVG